MKVKLSDIKPLTDEQLESLSRSDLLVIARSWQKKGLFLVDFVGELEERLRKHEAYASELEERILEVEGKLIHVQAKLFCPSSEKSPRLNPKPNGRKDPKPRSLTPKLPSERYPNADIIEKHVSCEQLPECRCCGSVMVDSGMVETSEYLTVVPKKYIVVKQHRHKYRCQKCHGDIVTTPAIPRVIPGSSYSDELIVDATLSKFCDLVPMERYCQMAKRQGFEGLPPHSLIGAAIKLAWFFREAYKKLRQETLTTSVLLGDETPHKMLEGDEKSRWYLWGFLSDGSCFYECHDSRSGEVATAVLLESTCGVLLTDVYSGYARAIREANEVRKDKGLPAIQPAYCNGHARREFLPPKGKEAPVEAQFMIDQYKKIYKLEATAKDQPDVQVLTIRQEMRPLFEEMKEHAETVVNSFSNKSAFAQAFNYFLKNFEGLILFLTNALIPIDNNPSERLLRGPVIGRKTWYGTHSKDGAEATAIHFSLIEACKLNKINPREYYADTIKRIHTSQPVLTPREFRHLISLKSNSS